MITDDETLPDYLEQEQVAALLKAAKAASIRDCALLLLVYKYGLRVHEASAFNRNQVNFAKRKIRIGTGFSDAQRASPPAIGSTITFRYQEFSDKRVPRFPSFVAHRTDIAVAEVPTAPKPAATKKASVSVAVKAGSSGEAARYFEFVDEKSSKFWEITVDDTEVTVSYSRIGSNGQSKLKSFDNSEAATAHADNLIAKKTNSGYEETDRPN